MITIKTSDMLDDFKRICALVFSGEKIIVARPHNENLVVLSEKEYNQLERAQNNMEYIKKLDRSLQQLASGNIIEKTMEELEAMAK
ncbi:MAG: type II toxin-antitoxin system Phd/YefM family antitoxin [Holosporales bacterium]|nr:type II toxin-antitoxin system Phd/YefM family antitoxin [Holosporales bacterium]